jgi:hypothetical protein
MNIWLHNVFSKSVGPVRLLQSQKNNLAEMDLKKNSWDSAGVSPSHTYTTLHIWEYKQAKFINT